MNRPEILQYHKDLASLLKSEQDRPKRRAYLLEERKSSEYQTAKTEAIERTHRELTPQEQTILWAQTTIEDYNNLPKGNNAERKKVKAFLEETAGHLLQNPQEIDSAASVWKARTREEQGGFYEAIKIACEQRAKEKWNTTTSAQLTEIVKVYTHSHFISDFTHSLLRGYFRGSEKLKDRVDSLYKFVYGLIDLALDTKVLGEGLKIVRFESEILPKDSSFKRDIDIAATSLADDQILIKAISINNTIVGLSSLIYPEEHIRDFMKYDSGKLETRRVAQANKALKKEPREVLLRKAALLHEAYVNTFGSVGEKDAEQFSQSWLGRILFAEDPLRKRFNAEVGPLFLSEQRREQVYEEAKKQGQDLIPFSLKTPEGYILDMYLPDSIPIDQWRDFMKMALEKASLSAEDKLFMEQDNSIQILNKGFMENGVGIWVFIRRSGVTELNRHELSALGEIGIPFMPKNNQELADEVLKRQIRFLNKRGVRVPLNGQLKEMGYTHIDFHKDANSDKTLVRIFVGDIPYTVKLDKYFDLDFEGKRLDNLALAESLRYVFLSLLRPILCDERIRDPHLPEMGIEEKEVVSRMGHLRWLPAGQRFSKTAVENYFRIEGKDLFVTNFQRLEEFDTDRETTYVKPVIEKEENLPPITIHLPGVLQFN